MQLSSDVKLGYHRDNQGKLTNWINGDRFVLIHPNQLKKPLPRNAQCGTFKCRIVYKGQFEGQLKECFMCFSTDHQGKNCPNPPCCRVCRAPGHDPGSPKCKHYYKNVNLKDFGGEGDPLSNHFKHEFKFKDLPAKTAENHFYFHKSMMNGQPVLARMCHDAPNGRKAKYLSKGIMCDPKWDEDPRCVSLMKDIVNAKIDQVEVARNELHDAWKHGKLIVEAVPNPRDFWWGSSLNKEGTTHTDPEFWPGSNTLGKIYMEIAVERWGTPPPPPNPTGLIDNVCEDLEVQSELENTGEIGDDESSSEDGEISDGGQIADNIEEEPADQEESTEVKTDSMPSKQEIADFVKAERSLSTSRSLPQETIASKLRARAAKSKRKGSTGSPSKSKTSPRTTSTKRVNNSPLGNVQKQPKPGSVNQSQSEASNSVSKLDKSNSKVS